MKGKALLLGAAFFLMFCMIGSSLAQTVPTVVTVYWAQMDTTTEYEWTITTVAATDHDGNAATSWKCWFTNDTFVQGEKITMKWNTAPNDTQANEITFDPQWDLTIKFGSVTATTWWSFFILPRAISSDAFGEPESGLSMITRYYENELGIGDYDPPGNRGMLEFPGDVSPWDTGDIHGQWLASEPQMPPGYYVAGKNLPTQVIANVTYDAATGFLKKLYLTNWEGGLHTVTPTPPGEDDPAWDPYYKGGIAAVVHWDYQETGNLTNLVIDYTGDLPTAAGTPPSPTPTPGFLALLSFGSIGGILIIRRLRK